jgi:hypothetical protein
MVERRVVTEQDAVTSPVVLDQVSLAGHPLLAGLRPDELATRLVPSNVVDLPAGAVLVRHGEPADCAYLVLAGRLQATVPTAGARRGHGGSSASASSVVGQVHRGELAGAGRRDRLEPGSLPSEGVVSGWRGLATRLVRPHAARRTMPGLVRTLARLTALGNVGPRVSGDLHLEHDLSRWGMFDWNALSAIAAAGYDNTRRALDDCGELLATLTAR